MTVAAPATSNCLRVTRAVVAAGMTLSPSHEGDGADRGVDEEDRLPPGPGGQGSAEQDAGGDAEGADSTPQGQSRGGAGRRSTWS